MDHLISVLDHGDPYLALCDVCPCFRLPRTISFLPGAVSHDADSRHDCSLVAIKAQFVARLALLGPALW